MSISISSLFRKIAPVLALGALVLAMGGTWAIAQPATKSAPRPAPAAPAPSAGTPASGAARPTAPSSATSSTADEPPTGRSQKPAKKQITGKLNLNTATEEQLMLLPTVGPSKAERILDWRKKNGGFKRTADLRRVKGFGYKTFKRLEPYLDITGETTLAVTDAPKP
jgi:competence protein ComEA